MGEQDDRVRDRQQVDAEDEAPKGLGPAEERARAQQVRDEGGLHEQQDAEEDDVADADVREERPEQERDRGATDARAVEGALESHQLVRAKRWRGH